MDRLTLKEMEQYRERFLRKADEAHAAGDNAEFLRWREAIELANSVIAKEAGLR